MIAAVSEATVGDVKDGAAPVGVGECNSCYFGRHYVNNSIEIQKMWL